MTEPIRADLLESGELPEGWEREEEVTPYCPLGSTEAHEVSPLLPPVPDEES